MARKKSETVPESNGPVSQNENFGSGQPTLAGVYRTYVEIFDRVERNEEPFR